MADTKEEMIKSIMQQVAVNKLTGNFKGSDSTVLLHLACCSGSALKRICAEMNIKTT